MAEGKYAFLQRLVFVNYLDQFYLLQLNLSFKKFQVCFREIVKAQEKYCLIKKKKKRKTFIKVMDRKLLLSRVKAEICQIIFVAV